MNQSQKIAAFCFIFLLAVLSIGYYSQERNIEKTLAECSVYTIAHVVRPYTNRGMARIEYSYSLNNIEVTGKSNVNSSNTGEFWMVNLAGLRKRRLLIKAYCKEPEKHQILWNVKVPDTVSNIPIGGWKELPFVARK